jgi:hypothetical protein
VAPFWLWFGGGRYRGGSVRCWEMLLTFVACSTTSQGQRWWLLRSAHRCRSQPAPSSPPPSCRPTPFAKELTSITFGSPAGPAAFWTLLGASGPPHTGREHSVCMLCAGIRTAGRSLRWGLGPFPGQQCPRGRSGKGNRGGTSGDPEAGLSLGHGGAVLLRKDWFFICHAESFRLTPHHEVAWQQMHP